MLGVLGSISGFGPTFSLDLRPVGGFSLDFGQNSMLSSASNHFALLQNQSITPNWK